MVLRQPAEAQAVFDAQVLEANKKLLSLTATPRGGCIHSNHSLFDNAFHSEHGPVSSNLLENNTDRGRKYHLPTRIPYETILVGHG